MTVEVPTPAADPAEPEPAVPPLSAAAPQEQASPPPSATPATPPGLLAAVMGLADTWGSLWSGISGQDTAQQQQPVAAGAGASPTGSEAVKKAEASCTDSEPAEREGSGSSAAAGGEGWDSPGSSLDELAYTALSQLEAPGTAGLATMAASRPPRQATAEFATPLPQPDWQQADVAEAASSSRPSAAES